MDRRHFVKNLVLSSGGLALPTVRSSILRGRTPDNPPYPAKLKIQYIREDIPPFEIPVYRGQSYQDTVPDTLDIAERAKLGVHALTSITDPAADYEVYWAASFFRNPPVMSHDFNDWVQICEGFQEALPLLRTATGDDLNSQVDRRWMEAFLKCIGPDGLLYVPLKGRPWSRLNSTELDPLWKPDGTSVRFSDDPSLGQVTSGEVCARALGTLTVYYLRDRNPLWKEAGERMVNRLSSLAVQKGDYCYLVGGFEPNAKVGQRAEMPVGLIAEEWDGRLIQGLSQYYRATGYEPAREMAEKLTKYFRYHAHYYDEQGRFLWTDSDRQSLGWGLSAKGQVLGGHGHGHTIGLLSMLEYATAVNNRDTLTFVKSSFEWAKRQDGGFGVSALVGWFPEWYLPKYPSCEGCIAADMIALGVKLSVAGLGDYWDDVDRWVRNDFAEQQLTRVDWVYRLAERQPRKPVAANEVAERMPERNVGAFAGWSSGNDWTIRAGIMHCCTGNSTRALYYLWENMIEHEQETLRVNLLLNRASRWADIYSYIPYQGRVDLKMKAPSKSVLVRAPEWVSTGSTDIVSKVNGTRRPLRWQGRYVDLGAAKQGDTFAVTFPISERTVKENIGPQTYSLALKGNTVVSIDPPGQNGPLYADRGNYRKDQVQWLKLRRFVPDESIRW